MKTLMAAVVLCAVACASGGCAVAGAIAAKTIGDIPDPAKYKLPNEPVLVVVENYNHPAELQAPADQLAEMLSQELSDLKMVPVVEQTKLTALRTARPKEFAQMKITDLGKEVGAQQIIYVDLRECQVYRTAGSDALQAKVEAYVKVVDVATGQTKYPVAGEIEPFKKEGNFTPEENNLTPLAVRNELVEDLSGDILKLFIEKKRY